MPTAGNLIRTAYLYLDASDNPLTGQTSPANITFQLMRDPGTGMVAASETITFAETATAGYYNVSFTPQNSGLYVLFAKELAGGQRQQRFDFQINAAGAVFAPSYQNAFCSESDVERWIQASITASTNPSSDQTAAFAESRAAQLQALCSTLNFPVTPSTVTSGSRLEDLLRDANAIGAAQDFLRAQGKGVRPFGATSIVDELGAAWNNYVSMDPKVLGFIVIEVRANLAASFGTDHILSGDAVDNYPTGVTDAGTQVGMGDLY